MSAYTDITFPARALQCPSVQAALQDEGYAAAVLDGQLTLARVEGNTSYGQFEPLELALSQGGFPWDRFAEDPGDGTKDTCTMTYFRPATPEGSEQRTWVPVTRTSRQPLVAVDRLDSLLRHHTTPSSRPDMDTLRREIGLPPSSLTAWEMTHSSNTPSGDGYDSLPALLHRTMDRYASYVRRAPSIDKSWQPERGATVDGVLLAANALALEFGGDCVEGLLVLVGTALDRLDFDATQAARLLGGHA